MANTNYNYNFNNNENKYYNQQPQQPPAYYNQQGAAPPGQAPNLQDPERGNQSTVGDNWGNFNALSEKNVRIRFIRKVYLIITAQLLFTFGIVALFVFVQPIKDFTKTSAGLGLYIASYIIFLALIITFSFCQCCGNGLRKVPYNYLLLIGITLSLTYLLAMISAYHRIEAVMMAVGVTLFVSIGVTLFSMQTRFDFTGGCVLVAICLSFALLGFGIIAGVASRYGTGNYYVLQAVYGGLGAALMALFLAIDTQLLIGNKRFRYSEEDYINAALQLYLDICYMFIYLLQIFGAGNK